MRRRGQRKKRQANIRRRRRKLDTYFETMVTKNEIRIDDFLKEDGRLNIIERGEEQT